MPDVSDEVLAILEDLGDEAGPHPLHAYVEGVVPIDKLSWEDLAYPLRLESDRLAHRCSTGTYTIYTRWVGGDYMQTVVSIDGQIGAVVDRDRVQRLNRIWHRDGVTPVLQENTPFTEVDRDG